MIRTNIILLDTNYDTIFKIISKIKKRIKENRTPKTIVYNLSTEYIITWTKIFFEKNDDSKKFTLPDEIKELYEIIEKYEIKFYLIVGCEKNEMFNNFYVDKSPNFNIIYWNTSLIFLPYYQLQVFIKNYKLETNIENLTINKKFENLYINYNNKPRYHRCLLMDQLVKNDLFNLGLNSWNQLSGFYEFKYWVEQKISIDDFEYYINDEYRQSLLKMNCFVSVVTETSDEILFVTEKTYRQILIEQPFLCLGAPNQNNILRNYGFELYDEIFDYEFDSKTNIEERVQGIIDNLNNIKNLNYYDLYNKIKDKVKRNKLNALKIFNEGLYFSEDLKKLIMDNRKILHINENENFSQTLISKFMSSLNNITIIEDFKIGVVGLGKLGFQVAESFSESFYVEGYDINELKETNFKIVNSIENLCQNKNIIFISVPTPHHPNYDGSQPTTHLSPKDFDYEIVKDILSQIKNHINSQTLVVLISTVLPGTIRNELFSLVNDMNFLYNPYLIAMGTVKEDLIEPEMIIIGSKDGHFNPIQRRLFDFYDKLISDKLTDYKPRYEIGTWEEAESIKIFYNTFISAKLSIVNMIQDVSEKLGNMDVDVVTKALEKSDKRIISGMYMKAGMGDGGPCHPRDNIALRFLAQKLDLGYDLFDSIMKSREVQAENISKKLRELSIEHNLPIVIMGESFKPGVSLTDGSYGKLIGSYLKDLNFKFDNKEHPSVFLLGHRHVYYDVDFPKGSVILDPWREYRKDKGNLVIYYGKR